jgi:Lon protease-like protein
MSNTGQITIPKKLAVMILPGATLFPHSILPLFIFEPRYRAMVADALDAERMFCIAQLRPGATDEDEDSVFEVGGVGVIRVCRGNEDGTSHLILQGTGRVRFTSYESTKPYPYAVIEPIKTRIEQPQRLADRRRLMDSLCARLAEDMDGMSHIVAGLQDLEDTEAATDIVAGACVSDPGERQILLAESSLDKRLDRVINHLQNALGD